MLSEILFSTMRMSTPLLFAAMAGLLCERSGVINIALEGLILIGAFTAAAIGYYGESAWLGWFAAGLAGIIVSILISWLSIQRKADQVVVGIGINLLVVGLVPFLSKILFDSTGSTPSLNLQDRFVFEPVLLAFATVTIIYIVLNFLKMGLWLQVAGEKPEALRSNGISVEKTRWVSVLMGGVLAAWGGATLSVYLASAYSPQMSGGRGFMALAALILGRWNPLGTMAACLFFGLTDALQIRMQGADLFGLQLPVQWVQMIPYLVTIVALAGFLGKARPPQSLGR